MLFQAARETFLRYPAASYGDRAVAAPFPSPPKDIRVVWTIFAELSQEIAFANRPPGLPLPNLDRLKASSFLAASAKAPGESTLVSMPSLIPGEQAVEASPRAQDILYLLTCYQSKAVPWSAFSNVLMTLANWASTQRC